MAKEPLEIQLAGIRLVKKGALPLYQQLYGQLRGMIVRQQLRPGERLPASRSLSQSLGVSRIIVNQAYELLVMEGYLVGKTGSGTFVAAVLPDQLLHAAPAVNPSPAAGNKQEPLRLPAKPAGATAVQPFLIGTPSLDFFPYKIWQQVGNRVLKELRQFNLGYEDTLGYFPLRKAIAAYLRLSRAVHCEAEQVVVVTGSQQGLNLVTASLLQQGDKVWMEDPGFPGARDAFGGAGVQLCAVPVEKDGLDLAYARRHFSDAKLAYVTPSHQFPLGCTLSQAKRKALLSWAAKSGMWILEDDYDSEFRYEGSPLASLQGQDEHGKVIYSGTFSKVLFPGLRLAYLVLPSPAMADRFRQAKNLLDRQSPIMEQLMVCRFMEEGHFLRHIRKMRLLYAERQQLLVQLVQAQLGDYFRLVLSPSGMHLVCWLSDRIDATRFAQEARALQLDISFINEYSLQHTLPPAIALGFTAFSRYRLKTGVEKLALCVQRSLLA
jgi:GntR family transcriptional regulator/MocR family aminotransferase